MIQLSLNFSSILIVSFSFSVAKYQEFCLHVCDFKVPAFSTVCVLVDQYIDLVC